jgi:hypothetical protein
MNRDATTTSSRDRKEKQLRTHLEVDERCYGSVGFFRRGTQGDRKGKCWLGLGTMAFYRGPIDGRGPIYAAGISRCVRVRYQLQCWARPVYD